MRLLRDLATKYALPARQRITEVELAPVPVYDASNLLFSSSEESHSTGN